MASPPRAVQPGSGYNRYKYNYQLSPILLVGGLAANVQGGSIPIISLTNPSDSALGYISGAGAADDMFAHFEPVAGSTLIETESAKFPFANQTAAANALVVQPLKISLLMRTPARGQGGFAQKNSIITALKSSLDQHIALGGLFTVVTPAYTYTSLLLLSLRLLQAERPDQPQSLWQWDFERPLLTLDDLAQAYSVSMSRMAAAIPQTGDPPALSGGAVNVGTTGSVAGTSAVPALSSSAAGVTPGPPSVTPPIPPTTNNPS